MPESPTPRFGIVAPSDGDFINLWPALMRAALAQVEDLAAIAIDDDPRPAAGTFGRVHRDTGTGAISFDTGSAWVSIVTPALLTSTIRTNDAATAVTALPGSPYDGQTVDYIADGANGVVWRLRYRSATSKWERVGGSPLVHEVSGAATLNAGTSNTDVSGGPTLTVPLTGVYDIEFGFTRQRTQSTGMNGTVAAAVGSAAVSSADGIDFADFSGATTGGKASESRTIRRSLAASDVLKHRYNEQYGASLTNRFLRILPVRVG